MMLYIWYPTDRNLSGRSKTAPYLPGPFKENESKISPGDFADMFSPSTYEGLSHCPRPL